MRINKLLSNFGYCSRKDTRRLIEEERVIINGKLAIQGQWVEIDEDEILIDNQPIKMKEKVYIALNKPVGVTCTAAKEVKDNIIDYVNYGEYIFPVGRLDKESQGLIILTNDGDFANDILEAENGHEKEYIVTVDKGFDDEFIKGMENGVEICGTITKPCKLTRINERTFKIILTQGLNKQIRRMCLVFGYKVQKLERIRILDLTIDGLEYGQWKHISKENILN